MIKNPDILEAFEQREIAGRWADPVENMRIFGELRRFALDRGRFSRNDPLEGIETVIRLSRILRSVKGTP